MAVSCAVAVAVCGFRKKSASEISEADLFLSGAVRSRSRPSGAGTGGYFTGSSQSSVRNDEAGIPEVLKSEASA